MPEFIGFSLWFTVFSPCIEISHGENFKKNKKNFKKSLQNKKSSYLCALKIIFDFRLMIFDYSVSVKTIKN